MKPLIVTTRKSHAGSRVVATNQSSNKVTTSVIDSHGKARLWLGKGTYKINDHEHNSVVHMGNASKSLNFLQGARRGIMSSLDVAYMEWLSMTPKERLAAQKSDTRSSVWAAAIRMPQNGTEPSSAPSARLEGNVDDMPHDADVEVVTLTPVWRNKGCHKEGSSPQTGASSTSPTDIQAAQTSLPLTPLVVAVSKDGSFTIDLVPSNAISGKGVDPRLHYQLEIGNSKIEFEMPSGNARLQDILSVYGLLTQGPLAQVSTNSGNGIRQANTQADELTKA